MIIYKFVCSCGCGQTTPNLKDKYIRLQPNQAWVAKGCEKESDIIKKEFFNGYIVEREEF